VNLRRKALTLGGAIIFVGSLLIPIPLLEGMAPLEQLAAPDDHFTEINSLTLH
jgi:hypothetical protein